jgi:hypothetical protein
MLMIDRPLVIQPALAVLVGLNEAIVIQQINYWLTKSEHIHAERRWVYNTMADWSKQFPFWGESTLRRIMTNLVKKGILLKGNYNKLKLDRTVWYSIDYDALDELETGAEKGPETGDKSPSAHIEQMDCSDRADDLLNMTVTIPETTTETKEKIEDVSFTNTFSNSLSDALFDVVNTEIQDKSLFKKVMSWHALKTQQGRTDTQQLAFYNKRYTELKGGWFFDRTVYALQEAAGLLDQTPPGFSIALLEDLQTLVRTVQEDGRTLEDYGKWYSSFSVKQGWRPSVSSLVSLRTKDIYLADDSSCKVLPAATPAARRQSFKGRSKVANT